MSQSQPQPLKLGLIGLGRIAVAQLVPACLQLPELDLVAVCRRRAEPLHRLADQYHVDHRFTDYRALLAHPGLDAVLVCTGPVAGPPIIHDALRQGLHVFTEKPLALDAATALELVQAAHGAGRVAAVGYMKLFYPAYARVRQLLAEQALGAPAALHARFWYQQGRRPDSAFHNDTHLYALVPALLGPVAEVGARCVVNAQGHATAVTFACDSGAVATVSLSSLAHWDYPYHESLELITERGHVLSTTNGRELYHCNPQVPDTAAYFGQTVSVHWRESEGFVAELRAFAQAIRQQTPAPVPFELGLQALRLAEAVEQSLHKGQWIPVGRDL